MYDDYSLTIGEGHRVESLGPMFGFESQPGIRQWRFSPLLSLERRESPESVEFDFLYPLLTYDRFESESRFQWMQLLSWSGGKDQEERHKSKFSLFPFYLSQQSENPEENYRAFIPFLGTVKDRFFRDEIQFFFYPLYVRTVKRDVETRNYLYPFFHKRTGDHLEGWQFWPLVGYESKTPFVRTNSFGNEEQVLGHEKRSVLWPIYFNHQLDLGSDHPGSKQALLPIYYRERTQARDYSSVLWPFFNYVDDREKEYREWSAFWPVAAYAKGEGKSMWRLWPFIGSARSESMNSHFFLWPLWKSQTKESELLRWERSRLLYFVYSNALETNKETGQFRRRVDLWPLFTYRRDFEGQRRFQAVSLLEPILPRNDSIERNYSPLWSIVRYESNPRIAGQSLSLFWNLFRHERQATSMHWSFLFGLFEYERTFESRQGRFLYFPFDFEPDPS